MVVPIIGHGCPSRAALVGLAGRRPEVQLLALLTLLALLLLALLALLLLGLPHWPHQLWLCHLRGGCCW